MNSADNKQTLHHRLLNELNAIDSDLDGAGSTIRVCSFALKALSDDVSEDVAAVLESVHCRLKDAESRLTNAINLMPELLRVESRHE